MLIAPNFVNHTEVNTFWKSFLKIVGVSFEHHWTEDTYPQYLESQGWKIEFSKTIVARLLYVMSNAVKNNIDHL